MSDVSQVYQKAEQMFQKGQIDYAISLWMQCILQDPNHEPSHLAWRAAVLKRIQQKGAPSRIKLVTLNAKTQGALKVTKDARKKMEICLAHLNEDPGNAGVRATLAEALLEAGYYDGAISEARMALEGDGKSLPAWLTLGAAYKAKGMTAEAQEAYEKALQIKPEDREIQRELRNLAAMDSMRRTGLETAKDYRDVIKDKEKAAELERAQHLVKTEDEIVAELRKLYAEYKANPQDLRAARKLADFLFDRKKDYKNARVMYQKCIELAPQDSFFKDRADDCAIRHYETTLKALEARNDPRAGEIRAQKLKFEIASYERRVRDRPTDMALRFELGRLYFEMPELTDKAIAEFQQAVKDPKKKTDAHIYLGLCFQRKKLYDLADGQFRAAEEGFVPDEKRLSIWYYRAVCAAEAGNLDSALELGKKIMQEDISYRDMSQKVSEWMAQKQPQR